MIQIIPVILGELVARRTTGRSKSERSEQMMRDISDWLFSNPYPVDWTIGANEGRSRTPGQNQVSQPRVKRERGGVITYDDGEMSIYARRSRS